MIKTSNTRFSRFTESKFSVTVPTDGNDDIFEHLLSPADFDFIDQDDFEHDSLDDK